MEEWPDIKFVDDHDGSLFTVTVGRNLKGQHEPVNEPVNEQVKSRITALQSALLKEIVHDQSLSYDNLAKILKRGRSTIMRNIRTLKEAGILKRIGPDKTGTWVVVKTVKS